MAMLVRSDGEVPATRLAIASLRAFGGRLAACPVRVFHPPDREPPAGLAGLGGVESVPLTGAGRLFDYPFAAKVAACARAEALASGEVGSVVWLNAGCLVVRPPVLLDLAPGADIALRPVHHRNVGALADERADAYWRGIYLAAGDGGGVVESFVDDLRLRPYYNTHLFSFDPAQGLMAEWLDLFRAMVEDQDYQSRACRDPLRRVFLHQAVLSALIARAVGPERTLILPPEYSYPLHLHDLLPPERRARRLEDLTIPVYEEPGDLDVLPAEGPLLSWLTRHRPSTDPI